MTDQPITDEDKLNQNGANVRSVFLYLFECDEWNDAVDIGQTALRIFFRFQVPL